MKLTRILSALFFAAIFVISHSGFAQGKKIITGSAVDKKENQPIRMASITNITLGKTTVSRSNGTFELEAAIGNIIAYGANGFYADTLSITPEQFTSGSWIASNAEKAFCRMWAKVKFLP
jgi:hypothetical protein